MTSTARLSAIFSPGDIVRVPFPYVEGDRLQARPALVVSDLVGSHDKLVWTLMITGARRSTWPGDISLHHRFAECGLPVPCLVRTEKIAALRTLSIEHVLGRLPDDIMNDVMARVFRYLTPQP